MTYTQLSTEQQQEQDQIDAQVDADFYGTRLPPQAIPTNAYFSAQQAPIPHVQRRVVPMPTRRGQGPTHINQPIPPAHTPNIQVDEGEATPEEMMQLIKSQSQKLQELQQGIAQRDQAIGDRNQHIERLEQIGGKASKPLKLWQTQGFFKHVDWDNIDTNFWLAGVSLLLCVGTIVLSMYKWGPEAHQAGHSEGYNVGYEWGQSDLKQSIDQQMNEGVAPEVILFQIVADGADE